MSINIRKVSDSISIPLVSKFLFNGMFCFHLYSWQVPIMGFILVSVCLMFLISETFASRYGGGGHGGGRGGGHGGGRGGGFGGKILNSNG